MYFKNLAPPANQKKEYKVAIESVITSGNYLYGPQLEKFEHDFAVYTGTNRCIGVANATDALTLIIQALRPTSVALPNFTALPTAVGIARGTDGQSCAYYCVDVDDSMTMDPNKIPKMLPGSVVVYVGLFGNIGNIERISEICRENLYWLIIDAAQSTGSGLEKYGHFAACSFYPTKPLGNFQDGGAILINLHNIYNVDFYEQKIRKLAFYGADRQTPTIPAIDYGMNSRLSEISAAILNVRLKYLDEEIEAVRQIARFYKRRTRETSVKWHPNAVYHQFAMRVSNRKRVFELADEQDIPLMIHYPYHIPDVLTAFNEPWNKVGVRVSDEIVSFPIYPEQPPDDQKRVAELFNQIHEEGLECPPLL